MRVIVCIKQVPATTQVGIDPQTNTLIRQGVESIINPFDTYALEEGVRIRERVGGAVTVITMGPPQAEEALRECVSLGADEAILLSDQAFAGADTLATSYTLAKAIEKLEPFDIVLCGRQTADGDTGQVGPELAEWLGVPIVTNVRKIHEISESNSLLERMMEEGYEVIEMPLPGIISVVKEINTPRLPSLRGMVRAKSAKIQVWTAQDLNLDKDAIGLAGSPTRVIKAFTPPKAQRGELIQGKVENQVEQLVSKLKEIKVI